MSGNEVTRFAAGEIKGYNLSRTNKSGSYGFGFEGYYEDTKDKLEGYFGSKFPIKVFEGDNDPIDPEGAQDLRFKGRVMFTEKEYNGKTYTFPQAISIEKRIEVLERTGGGDSAMDGNPFLDNPINK